MGIERPQARYVLFRQARRAGSSPSGSSKRGEGSRWLNWEKTRETVMPGPRDAVNQWRGEQITLQPSISALACA